MTISSRQELVEAIAWWRVRLPGARRKLVDAAVALLVEGADATSIAEMAGMPESEDSFSVDSLVQHAADELALEAELAVAPEIIAVRSVCRSLLAGEMRERTLSRWVYHYFRYEGESELLLELAVMSDDYDGVEGGWSRTPGEVLDRRVREIARMLLEAG